MSEPIRTVLVIEDSTSTLRMLSRLLRENGYLPVEASSLAETKAQLATGTPYLCAIMDYTLPDAPDGEALPLLLDAKIPTIILTGNTDQGVRERLLMEAVFDYVPKDSPAAFEYLLKMVRRVERNPQLKVLLVDDSVTIRNYLRTLLERQCYQVLEAPDAETALALLKTEKGIKLVLADQDMPGMNGVRMTSEIRRMHGPDSMAIVGLSGSNQQGLTARFIKAGADDFLQKPFNHEEFFCRVTRNIEFIENIAALAHAANTDALTGLYNRRKFFAEIGHQQGGCTIAMLDIDHFKKINDRYGHNIGDLALQHVSRLLQTAFANCLVARFGGEEFAVLLPGYTPMEHRARLQAFCNLVAASPIGEGEEYISVTISIGFASAAEPNIPQLIKLADDNLYKAKSGGRNQVCP